MYIYLYLYTCMYIFNFLAFTKALELKLLTYSLSFLMIKQLESLSQFPACDVRILG